MGILAQGVNWISKNKSVTEAASGLVSKAQKFLKVGTKTAVVGGAGYLGQDAPNAVFAEGEISARPDGGAGVVGYEGVFQYPETLGTSFNDGAYESDPEKNDSHMFPGQARGDHEHMSSKTKDPFITFTFKEVAVTNEMIESESTATDELVEAGFTVLAGTLIGKLGKKVIPGDAAGDILENVAVGGAAVLSIPNLLNAWDKMQANKGIDQKTLRHTRAHVALYLPPAIQISDSAEWEQTDRKAQASLEWLSERNSIDSDDSVTGTKYTTSAKVGAYGVLGNVLTGGGILGAVGGAGVVGGGATALAGTLINLSGADDLRRLGRVLNPNELKQFKSTQLRTFTLQFKFLPKSANESVEASAIIKQFRKGMYPIKQDAISMVVPDIVEIKMHNAEGMVKLPDCAITNVAINYNPNNASFFKRSNMPVEIDMSITLDEIYPIHRSDVESGE